MPPLKKQNPTVNASSTLKVSDTNSYVYVEKSVTKNTGEYESAKVVVGLCLPLNPTEQELVAAYATIRVVTELVDERIIEEVNEICDGIKTRG